MPENSYPHFAPGSPETMHAHWTGEFCNIFEPKKGLEFHIIVESNAEWWDKIGQHMKPHIAIYLHNTWCSDSTCAITTALEMYEILETLCRNNVLQSAALVPYVNIPAEG